MDLRDIHYFVQLIMSGRVSSFMLLYNGELIVNENFVPTYIGGENRPLEVPTKTTLHDFKCRVLQALQYDISRYQVSLVCRVPVGQCYVATSIEDEDVCRIVMRQARTQFLILYVAIEPSPSSGHICQFNEGPSSGPTMNMQNEEDITPSLPPQQHYSWNTTFTSTQSTECFVDRPDEPILDHHISEDSYETMSSGSSEAYSDDFEISNLNEDIVQTNERTNTLIMEYCDRTADAADCMIFNNEYYAACRTSKQWDREINFDTLDVNLMTESDLKIPNELVEGMCFSSKGNLQFAIQGWSITKNVEYVVIASNTKKFTATCVHNDLQCNPCQWRLHAALSKRLGGAWKLSSLSRDHTCMNPILESGHRQCTSKFISYFILPEIRRQLDLKPREIMARIEAKFNVRVTYIKAWDARRKALKVVFGSWEESYRSIYLFMEAVKFAMPGSVYRVQSSQSNRFERIFWAFQPCIVGWTNCRPVLSLDGTFLVGKYRGTLLTAIGIDGNNGLFPLAFAIVESECNDSWFWFLYSLKDLIPETNTREDLCFISDRHAGIIRACRELFPAVAHRTCLRHLRENFKKAIRKMGITDVEFLCQKMYQAGCTSDIRVFNRNMTDIRNVKEEAYQWLIDRDISRWTLTHDQGYRYGSMTTNAAESFNGVLKRARGLPIQALITAIYYNIIGIFNKRRNQIMVAESEPNNIFCRTTLQTLINLENEARHIQEPIRINQEEFQVFEMSGCTYRVDILNDGQCRCQCGKPEIYHIPCAHAIACLSIVRRSHYDYVSPYFTLNSQKETYAMNFHCISDRSDWSDYNTDLGFIPLTPPNYRRRSGRPRVRRYKNTMDETASTSRRTCSYCHVSGHNRSTCPRRLSHE